MPAKGKGMGLFARPYEMETGEGMEHEMGEGPSVEAAEDMMEANAPSCAPCMSVDGHGIVPFGQSASDQSMGYARQVRSYPEVPDVEPFRLSKRVR
jgi:hypothetical protein